jgi:hypothetical protein
VVLMLDSVVINVESIVFMENYVKEWENPTHIIEESST